MASFEDIQNNKFYRLGGALGDLMILSGLWVLCCLPIVTIGPSTAALYYSINKRFNRKADGTASLFFHSFKDNLRQGILLTILYIVFCGFIVFDIKASIHGIGSMKLPEGYKMFAYVLILPVVFTIFYIFPCISRYSNTVKKSLANSFLLSAGHIDHTLYLILMNAVTAAGCIFFPPALLVLPGLCALLSSKLIEKDFAAAEKQAEEAANAAETEVAGNAADAEGYGDADDLSDEDGDEDNDEDCDENGSEPED